MSRGNKGILAGLALLGLGLMVAGPSGAQLVTTGSAVAAVDDLAPAPASALVADVNLGIPNVTLSWALSPSDKVRSVPVTTDFTSNGVFVKGNDVAGYQVWRTVLGGATTLITTVAAGGTSFVDDTVLGGSGYSYDVKAVDAFGNVSTGITSEPVTLGPPPVFDVAAPAGTVGEVVQLGEVNSGASSRAAFVIGNIATVTDASVLRVTATVAGAGFTRSKATLSIARGALDTVSVIFSATEPQNLNGTYTGTLTLNTNDPTHLVATYQISATVVGGPIAIADMGTFSGNFGLVKVDSLVEHTLTITNNGTLALAGTLALTGSAAFSVSETAISLAGGASQDITVSFTPAVADSEYFGLIVFTSNDAARPVVTVGLAGRGRGAVPVYVDPSTGNPIQGDFDGLDGVTFDDFFAFADHFGESLSSGVYNVAYDVAPPGAPDGRVDFDDFFVFADNFGKVGVYR